MQGRFYRQGMDKDQIIEVVFLPEFSNGVLGCLYTLTGGNHFGPLIPIIAPKRSTVSKQ